jgi:hypothetical protein
MFVRAGDAEAFDIDVKRRRQLGGLAPGVIQSRLTTNCVRSAVSWLSMCSIR